MRRKTVFIIVLIAQILVLISGALTPIDEARAEELLRRVKELARGEPKALLIFGNNLTVAMAMLIPFLGFFIGGYALYNTGLAFSATSLISGQPTPLLLLITVLMPFFWLEFAAYATSMTQNFYIITSLVQKRFRSELRKLVKSIIIIVILLLLSAVIEALIIGMF